jgi:hypothetical protein
VVLAPAIGRSGEPGRLRSSSRQFAGRTQSRFGGVEPLATRFFNGFPTINHAQVALNTINRMECALDANFGSECTPVSSSSCDLISFVMSLDSEAREIKEY